MNPSNFSNSSDWERLPDWIGCANGCACAPAKGRDICIVCVVASEGRCKRVEPLGLARAEQQAFSFAANGGER